MKKQIIILLFIGFQNLLFSQVTISATVSLGKWTNCARAGGICTFSKTNTKANANAQINYDSKTNELVIIFNKIVLEKQNKNKLLKTKLEKDFYLYKFDENFVLPKDILKALGIKKTTTIKQANYLVKVKGDDIIMTLQLI